MITLNPTIRGPPKGRGPQFQDVLRAIGADSKELATALTAVKGMAISKTLACLG